MHTYKYVCICTYAKYSVWCVKDESIVCWVERTFWGNYRFLLTSDLLQEKEFQCVLMLKRFITANKQSIMALNPMQWRLQIETFLNQNRFLLDAITIGLSLLDSQI